MTAAELEELDNLLTTQRTRGEEIPQWEFCDGFMTAVICSRRPIAPAEYLPMLLGDGAELEVAEGEPLPLLPVPLPTPPSKRAFWSCGTAAGTRSWPSSTPTVKTLDDDRTFQPEAMDMRGAVASLPEAERAEMGKTRRSHPSARCGPWASCSRWKTGWRTGPPRDKEAAQWLDDALDSIVALTEDDTGKPEVCMYDEDGPPSTSQARVEAFGEAIWAVYDLRQLWKSMGPRVETLRKAPSRRNDPCHCGSGKKYKKCHEDEHNL